jgi:hypothetical protein
MDSKQVVRGHILLRANGDNPASKSTQQIASQSLREHGLIVKRASPLAITVEADPETYERTFHAKLDENEGVVYWTGNPTIPDKLSDVITDVVFPKPVNLTVG